MSETIKGLVEDTNRAFDEFKKVNDERIAALEKGKLGLAAELDAKLDRINADIAKQTALKKELDVQAQINAENRERIEDLESKRSNPGMTKQEIAKKEHKDAFNAWVRDARQNSPVVEQRLFEAEKKDITIGTASAGGHAVPEEISRDVGLLQQKYSPFRSLVKVVTTGTSDYKELLTINSSTSGWVGETGSRTATLTPTLREVAPTHGELYAYPQASEWSLDDMFFNVEQWLTENVARSFAIAEAVAIVSGNGSNKPTGMLNSTPTTVSDEAGTRAAAVYQYILGADNTPASVDADTMIDLFYTLNSAYRSNAVWIMNSLTAGQVRKLKDSQLQYLWQPSLIVGQPDTILGKPIAICEQLSDPLGGTFPLAFGDFKQGYLLTQRTGLRITRDNVTNVGYVRFYVRQRVGGIVLNNDAVKWLKLL